MDHQGRGPFITEEESLSRLERLNREKRQKETVRILLIMVLIIVIGGLALRKLDLNGFPNEMGRDTQDQRASSGNPVVTGQPEQSDPASQCESSPPPNGRAYLFNRFNAIGQPFSKMQITNRHSHPIVVGINGPDQVRYQAISIYPLSTFEIGVPVGAYSLQVMVGDVWCNPDRGFLHGKRITSNQLTQILPGVTKVLTFESRGQSATDIFLTSTDLQPEPPAPVTPQPKSMQIDANGVVTLHRQANGGYYIDGSINGVPTTFQIDTGAGLTSIPKDLAYKAGVYECTPRPFETANGSVTGCVGIARNLTFGNFRAGDVEVAAMPNLKNPLLGMNLLGRIGMAQSGGVMKLLPPSEGSQSRYQASAPAPSQTYRPPEPSRQDSYARAEPEEESDADREARCYRTYAQVRDNIDARMRQGYSSQEGEWLRERQRQNERTYSECRS